MSGSNQKQTYLGSRILCSNALLRLLTVTLLITLAAGAAFVGRAGAAPALTPPVKTSPANAAFLRDKTPTFQWNAVTGATKYRIMVDNNADFSSPRVINMVTATSFTPPKPLSDNRYYWRVQAGDAAGGWSGWGTPWTFTIDTKPPPRPDLLAPANNSNTTDSTPAFDWSSPAGVTKYRIMVDSNGNFSSPERNKLVTNSSFTPASPLPNCLYYWRVRAFDAAGNASAWSAVWIVIVDTSP